MTGDLIRVVLADDHDVVRAGLQAVLRTAKDVDVVGQASTAEEALALVDRFHPHVVVMDLSMNGMDGLTATRDIVARNNGSRVLVLTMHAEKEYLVPSLEAGASGYLVKNVADRELVDAVRAVANGDVYVSPSAARVLARGLTTKDPHQQDRERFGRLTEREQEVLRFTAQGYSAPEIGRKLSISPKTVDTYKQRINEKVGLSHRAEYVQLALRLGLLASA
ncbi:MAG TPA: response regulator transcription factor [Gemmatimonadaceae bacterium]